MRWIVLEFRETGIETYLLSVTVLFSLSFFVEIILARLLLPFDQQWLDVLKYELVERLGVRALIDLEDSRKKRAFPVLIARLGLFSHPFCDFEDHYGFFVTR